MMAQKPQDAERRKLISAARLAGQHAPPGLPPAFFLTDPKRTPDPEAIAGKLPAGWGIIYRHYGAEDRLETATRLANLARKRRLTLLVSADPTLAMLVGAHGVHWPFARWTHARKWRGRFSIMTASAHNARELKALDPQLLQAALISTVFPSDSPSARTPIGPLRLARLSRQTQIPLIALGGVTAQNAKRIAGQASYAAIDGIVGAFDA